MIVDSSYGSKHGRALFRYPGEEWMWPGIFRDFDDIDYGFATYVTPVPVPAALVLMSSATLLLSGIGSRRKQRAN